MSKILKMALNRGGEFADLYFEKTLESGVLVEDERVEDISSGADQGVGLRILDNNKTIYGFSNQVDLISLNDMAKQVSQALDGPGFDKEINLKTQAPSHKFPIKINPFQIPTPQKVELCKKASEFAWDLDDRICQVSISYSERLKETWIANTLEEAIENSILLTSFVVSISAAQGDEIYSSLHSISGHCGYELFDQEDVFEVVKKTVNQALQNLSAPSIKGGKMPVVLASSAGGTIIHEAVGHGLEADLVCDGMSVFANKIGQTVANPNVTVIDDATLPGRRGSFSFDDEGTKSQKTTLIENGVLKSYMSDRLSAMKLGINSSGNGRRQSYEYKPVVRMTNTYLAPGTESPENILKSVPNGLFVKDMGGGQVNTVNGDFVFECTEAYLIRDGEIAEPVKNASLIGNGAEVIRTIDKIGNDLGFSSGTCGKDDQSAPVSDAIPTILIPQLTVGGVV